MSKNVFSQRVPVFGRVEINLENESASLFKKKTYFRRYIDRLNEINQLGILHNFLKIPQYTRYDSVLIMVYLTGKAAEINKDSEFNFKSKIKILNSTFSSLEELLKSWVLIYSIGHFQMTFASEHAFLKSVVSKEGYKSRIKEEITDFFNKASWFEDYEKDDLKRVLWSIIDEEKVMEVYKIFTLFKVDKCINKLDDTFKEKIRELTKLMIFKTQYSQLLYENGKIVLTRKRKLERAINYFDAVRMLTFTILDGSISQDYVNIDYMSILGNLNAFMEDLDYQRLLKGINEFYTSEIYDSPESAYYHYLCVMQVQEDVFKEELSINNILDESREKSLDKKILNSVNGIKDVDIKAELINHIRLKVEELPKPISMEVETFGMNENKKLFGGLMYNQALKCLEIDFYPNSIFSDKKRSICSVLTSLNPIYDNLSEKAANWFKYTENSKLIKEFVPESSDELGIMDIITKIFEDLSKEDFTKFLKKFDGVASYLVTTIFKTNIHFDSWDLNNKNIKFPIFFRGTELARFIRLLEENSKVKNKSEFERNIYLLKEEQKCSFLKDIFYLYAPNSEFSVNKEKDTEVDCLLVKFSLKDGTMVSKIGEVKRSEDSFNEEQCSKQLQLAFGLPESRATPLCRSTIEEAESKINIKIKGEKSDNLLLFEKSEKFEE